MSETSGNGQAGPATPAGPSLTINAQYLRDLSFENPRAPESLMAQSSPPEVKIDVDIKARQLSPDTYESVLTLKIEARQGDQVAFVVELDYAGVVTIRNDPQDLLAALILIETPRILFPFARAIVSDATRDGGFPPLMINPIDFAEVQRRKAAQAQASGVPAASND